ncbi:MAG: hypothetical protein KAH57_03360, partial [Thermoplasmata archaeon]|nr:hypothetical protein [Thermoplasmata archaeon]
RELFSLMLRSPDGTQDLFDYVDVDLWQTKLDTKRWPLGYNVITVSAVDAEGNSEVDSVKINILTDEIPFIDREDPVIIFDIKVDKQYELGNEILITGKVIDDGNPSDCTLGYSLGSIEYVDITGSMEMDGSFEWEFDTGEIDISNVDDPELMFHILDHLQIDLLVVDGVGNDGTYTIDLKIIDALPPVLIDKNVEQTTDGDISIDLLMGEDTMVTDLTVEVRDSGGKLVSRKKLDNRDLLVTGGDFRYTDNIELHGKSGDMTIHITASDRWGNTLRTSDGIFIKGGNDDAGSSMTAIFMAVAVLILIIFVIVYLVVRGSRVEKL